MFKLSRFPLFLLLFSATTAFAATTVPLNTGYDHGNYTLYPAAGGNPTAVKDHYWTNIATYPTTNPPVGPSWVLQTPAGWAPPVGASHWIGPRNMYQSAPGVTQQNPGYTIFRKCFCLLPNFKKPSITFRMRADDNVEVWFNSVLNKLVNQTIGNWWPAAQPLTSLPSNPAWFRVGRNCIYVLVEDVGGSTGFTMDGNITADGLLPTVAIGNEAIPCCPQPHPATASTVDAERTTIDAIRKVAEERRKARKQIIRPQERRQ